MSEKYLTLGEALKAAVDDGAEIGVSIGFDTFKYDYDSYAFIWMKTRAPMHNLYWKEGSQFYIIKKKKRLLTIPELFEKFPEAKFDLCGDLSLNDMRAIGNGDLYAFGGTDLIGYEADDDLLVDV